MASTYAFMPQTAVFTVPATTTSVNQTIDTSGGPSGDTLMVYNATTGIAFVRAGSGTQTAVLTDYPIAPNSKEILRLYPNCTDFAVILSAGTGNVYVAKGQGL